MRDVLETRIQSISGGGGNEKKDDDDFYVEPLESLAPKPGESETNAGVKMNADKIMTGYALRLRSQFKKKQNQ